MLSPDNITLLRIALLLLLALYVWRSFMRVPVSPRIERAMRYFAVLLAALSVFAFTNFGKFHAPNYGYVHYWDVYHYYMGSKYLPELGYTKLYDATFIAGRELGTFRRITHIKSLVTYDPVPVTRIVGEELRARFTSERWDEFKNDLKVFLPLLGPWQKFFFDHGYNDTPPRALLLGAIANVVPATPTTIPLLTLIDYLLLIVALSSLVAAFGLRIGCVLISFFSLNFLAGFDFIGGSFLRWDWIATIMIGVAVSVRKYWAFAGVCFAYATMARVFPFLLAAPLLLKCVPGFSSEGQRVYARRFCTGYVVSVLVIAIATLWQVPSKQILQESYDKLKFHSSAPFSNQIGMRQVLTFAAVEWKHSPEGVQYVAREEARNARRETTFAWFCTLLVIPLIVVLIKHASLLQALQYGPVLIFFALTPTNYYYSFLILSCVAVFARSTIQMGDFIKIAGLIAVMLFANFAELQSREMLPLYFKVSIALACYFFALLLLEFLRIRKAHITPNSEPQ